MGTTRKVEGWFKKFFMNDSGKRTGELLEQYKETKQFKRFWEEQSRLESRIDGTLPRKTKAIVRRYGRLSANTMHQMMLFFYKSGMADCWNKLKAVAEEDKKQGHLVTFEDRSLCFVTGKERHIHMGKELAFVFKIRTQDSIVYENMDFDREAAVPKPEELAKLFQKFGAECCYEMVSDNHAGRGNRKSKG